MRLRFVLVPLVCGVIAAMASWRSAPRPAPEPADRFATITAAQRADGLRFAAGVAPADRAWIEGALAEARPEARALVAEVDGMVEVRTHAGQTAGFMLDEGRGRLIVSLDPAALAGEGEYIRRHAVLHEFGHVVDTVLLDDALVGHLDRGIPASDLCLGGQRTGDCAPAHERVADTFAKWAVRSPGYTMMVGYHVATPPDLDAWGAPLADMAAALPT